MRRYFFDIVDGGPQRDDIGTDCADDKEMRCAALRALPDIAREEISQDGDRKFFTVVARNEKYEAVYAATLSFSGMWLTSRPED